MSDLNFGLLRTAVLDLYCGARRDCCPGLSGRFFKNGYILSFILIEFELIAPKSPLIRSLAHAYLSVFLIFCWTAISQLDNPNCDFCNSVGILTFQLIEQLWDIYFMRQHSLLKYVVFRTIYLAAISLIMAQIMCLDEAIYFEKKWCCFHSRVGGRAFLDKINTRATFEPYSWHDSNECYWAP